MPIRVKRNCRRASDNDFKYDGNYDTDKIKNFLLYETFVVA
jgi:hypothetical protein